VPLFRRGAADPARQLREHLDAAYRASDAESWDEAATELARAVEAARVVGIVQETVQVLCAACSEGRVDSDPSHDHTPSESGAGRCQVGIAATADDADRLLQRWIQAAPARRGAGSPETVA